MQFKLNVSINLRDKIFQITFFFINVRYDIPRVLMLPTLMCLLHAKTTTRYFVFLAALSICLSIEILILLTLTFGDRCCPIIGFKFLASS